MRSVKTFTTAVLPIAAEERTENDGKHDSKHNGKKADFTRVLAVKIVKTVSAVNFSIIHLFILSI